jgi:urease accessory protein
VKIALKQLNLPLFGAALIMLAGSAWAHPGHIGHDAVQNTLSVGLTHPLTGFDHMLAMLAVGLWSALTHQTMRKAMLTPVSFLALLFSGALLGMAGLQLPAVEPMIIASLFVLGLLVATRFAVPQWASFAIVGVFAVFHGAAHGTELPSSGSPMAFVAGFMVSTLALHLAGLLVGFKLKLHDRWIARVLGMGIAAYGATLLAGL